MDLPTLWFCIIAYQFAGFFFLEGFDYGVGILNPFLSKSEEDRRMTHAAIGGVWDGNETWMLTAGIGLFASFPLWYSTLVPGLFLSIVLLLTSIIARNIGVELRNKHESLKWRHFCDRMASIGSLIAAVLWGVVVGNLLRGFQLDAEGFIVGGVLGLIHPFSLVSALMLLLVFLMHGAIFLSLKLTEEPLKRVEGLLYPLYFPALIVAAGFLVYAHLEVGLLNKPLVLIFMGIAVLALVACGVLIKVCKHGAFWMSGLAIISFTAGVFAHMFPNVIVSAIDPAYSLTIAKAHASDYTLKIITIVAMFSIPAVVIYQGWTYWVLRQRIQKNETHY